MSERAPLDTEEAVCERHGPFMRRKVVGPISQWIPYIGRCPACVAEWEACDAARAHVQRTAELRANAHIPSRFANKGFAAYKPKTDLQRLALARCEAFVRSPDSITRGKCLVLIGPTGVGKTHLLTSIVAALVNSGIAARYTSMPEILTAIRGNWAWHGIEHGTQFVKPPVLALDELWEPSPTAREAMNALLDARYSQSRSTVAASNHSWVHLIEEFGQRFCDRLLEGGGEVLRLDGPSHRSEST